jgi:hypothetical protein
MCVLLSGHSSILVCVLELICNVCHVSYYYLIYIYFALFSQNVGEEFLNLTYNRLRSV